MVSLNSESPGHVIGSCPIVLPKIVGYGVQEGPLVNQEVYHTLSSIHPLVAEVADFWRGAAVISAEVRKNLPDLPQPKIKEDISLQHHKSLQVAPQMHSMDPNSPFAVLKAFLASIAPAPPSHQIHQRGSSMLPEIANPPITLLGDDASTLGPKSVREKFEKGLSAGIIESSSR